MNEGERINLILPDSSYGLGTQTLKQQCLACLESLSTTAVTLRRVVNEFVDMSGATRPELIKWALEAGYNERSIRSLISKLLCAKGRRRRKTGAGRKPNRRALEILAWVRAQYGPSSGFLMGGLGPPQASVGGGSTRRHEPGPSLDRTAWRWIHPAPSPRKPLQMRGKTRLFGPASATE